MTDWTKPFLSADGGEGKELEDSVPRRGGIKPLENQPGHSAAQVGGRRPSPALRATQLTTKPWCATSSFKSSSTKMIFSSCPGFIHPCSALRASTHQVTCLGEAGSSARGPAESNSYGWAARMASLA